MARSDSDRRARIASAERREHVLHVHVGFLQWPEVVDDGWIVLMDRPYMAASLAKVVVDHGA